jgi:hypothetical protein
MDERTAAGAAAGDNNSGASLASILGFRRSGLSHRHPDSPSPTVAFDLWHLPFKATTIPGTVIYRWEAYPTSRRINRSVNPPTIAQDTYAAPASEAPFAVTGFAAVARFALPNLMPACFRYELQPVAGTLIECGRVRSALWPVGGRSRSEIHEPNQQPLRHR